MIPVRKMVCNPKLEGVGAGMVGEDLVLDRVERYVEIYNKASAKHHV